MVYIHNLFRIPHQIGHAVLEHKCLPSGTSMMPLAIVLRSTFPPEYPKFGSLCINPPPPILFPEINPPVFPTASPTDQPPDFFFFLSPTGSCSLSLPDGRRRSTFRFSVPLFPAQSSRLPHSPPMTFVPMPLLVFPVPHPKAAGIPFAGPFRQQHSVLVPAENGGLFRPAQQFVLAPGNRVPQPLCASGEPACPATHPGQPPASAWPYSAFPLPQALQ